MIALHLSEEERVLVASLLPESHPLHATLEALPAFAAEVSRLAEVVDRGRLTAAGYAQAKAEIEALWARQDEMPHVLGEAQRLMSILRLFHGDDE